MTEQPQPDGTPTTCSPPDADARDGPVAAAPPHASSADPTAHAPAPGVLEAAPRPERAGRFVLGEELARGGMGVVYRARDESLGRDVAVKLLADRYAADSAVGRRFLDEARVTAQLQHPGVPPVFEVGRLPDGRPYLAMKLIKGRTLEDLLRERPDPAADRGRFLAVFQQVCQAVAYAHSRHTLHRDLKPANVMVGAFGEVQVMDWGLAKVLGAAPATPERPPAGTEPVQFTEIRTEREADSATEAGSVLGTPAYMAPEQAGGEIDKLDERADVFGLGAILCAVLTGQPPFVGRTQEEVRLMAIRGALADALGRLDRCGADPELVDLCRRCLSAEREGRPRDAGAVAAAVAEHLAGVEERARRAEVERAAAEARAAEQPKRRRVQLALAAAVLALLALAGAGLWWRERVQAAAAAERAARASWTTASVAEALRDARERSEEAWRLVDYPDRMQRSADAAVAALRRADEFAAGGAPAEATLAELADARREVDEVARHARLISTCLDTQYKFADEVNSRVGTLKARALLADRHREALRQFGLDPVEGSADEVAQAIAGSRMRDALLGMLLEWYCHTAYLAGLQQKYPDKVPTLPAADPVVKERLWAVVRSSRRLCGGSYARWQELLDRKDVPGLVAFAASPEALTFRANLVNDLCRNLSDSGQPAAARALLRAAVDRYPHDIWLHHDLYVACMQLRPPDYAEALRHIAAASVLRPESGYFHVHIGDCCAGLGANERAAAAYRKAIALSPTQSYGYEQLGTVLAKLKDWDEAIAANREAIRLAPQYADTHLALAVTLASAGRHAEALRVTLEALRQNSAWADEPRNQLRYCAACFAVNCADGLGTGTPPPAERPACRKQALEFLTADLATLGKLADTERALVHAGMRHWLADSDLASVRDPEALQRLPTQERAAWEKLWAGVRDLRDRTAPPPARTDKPPTP
jgi:serine/threonine-protein kinase